MLQFRFARLNPSEAEAKTATSEAPAARAAWYPFRFGVSAA
jgi:hypothetical protein